MTEGDELLDRSARLTLFKVERVGASLASQGMWALCGHSSTLFLVMRLDYVFKMYSPVLVQLLTLLVGLCNRTERELSL